MRSVSKSILISSVVLLTLAIAVVVGGHILAKANERDSSKREIEVAVAGAPQTNSFAEAYAQSAKFDDAYGLGRALLNQAEYKKAIERYNIALVFAQSTVEKAMVYSKLAVCYEKLGDVENQIKYLELDSQATLSKKDREQTLQKISELRRLLRQKANGQVAAKEQTS